MKLKYIDNWLTAFCLLLFVMIWYLFTASEFPPVGRGR